MKTILALTTLLLSLATIADARPRDLFLRLDSDGDRRVDELELKRAFEWHDAREEARIAKLELVGAPEAASLKARYEAGKRDALIGKPDDAASFILANFDADGDQGLDKVELLQAFSSLRRWAS